MDGSDNVERVPVVSGTVTGFLRRNLFRVRLDDGQEVTAVMPERLLPLAADAPMGFRCVFLSAKVLLREPPAIPLIVEARISGLTGAGWSEAPPSPFQ